MTDSRHRPNDADNPRGVSSHGSESVSLAVAQVKAGLIGGAIAALVMLLVAMIHGVLSDTGGLAPLHLVAAIVRQYAAELPGGSSTLVLAFAVLLVIGALAGIIFAFAIRRVLSHVGAMIAGLLYGATLWGVTGRLVLPTLDPAMLASVATTPGSLCTYHLIFGATLATIPWLYARLSEPHYYHAILESNYRALETP